MGSLNQSLFHDSGRGYKTLMEDKELQYQYIDIPRTVKLAKEDKEQLNRIESMLKELLGI
jgi:hypothetical protein